METTPSHSEGGIVDCVGFWIGFKLGFRVKQSLPVATRAG